MAKFDLFLQQSESKEEAEIEEAINKLNNAKKRVVVVANILQGAQDRLNKVHKNCLKETSQRRTLLEPSEAHVSVPLSSNQQ